MDFIPSEYQKLIFKFITEGVGNAVVNAKAGSGKTTTLVEAMKLVSPKQKVLFVAFNKAIEQDLSEKLEDYGNVTVKTYHSLGFAIVRECLGKYAKFEINEHKYTAYINNNIESLCPESANLNRSDMRVFKSNLKQLVDFARYNLAQSPDEMSDLCTKYGITPILNECDIIPAILEWGKMNIQTIDYGDMIWLCIERDLITYNHKYDFIFIDEAQDSSIMQQELIKKCYKRGTRFVAIGDDFQCINAFAGADQEAFKKFQSEPNTITLDLPITYRCPKNIVNYVREATGVDIIAAEHAIDGEIKYEVNPFQPKDNDMVLCRNTAHLVKLYMQYNRVNKKSYLKGRNIGETFKNIIQQTGQDYLSQDMMCDGVFPRLYFRLFEIIDKEILLTGLEYEDVVNTRVVMDYIDTIKALEVLSEGIIWKTDLINKIDAIFTDDDTTGVCLSTIHKAKGLEADNVYILCDSLLPSKYARKKWEIEAEENLRYVAITRAKKTLNYISETLFPPNLFGDNDNIISELEVNRSRMNRALNIDSTPPAGVVLTREEQITEDVKKIMNTHNSTTRVVNEKKRQNVGGNKFAKFLK
jgi:DNA helicase-2/ATP-dependent DNA helicase PcrA